MFMPRSFPLNFSSWQKSITAFVITLMVASAIVFGASWQRSTYQIPLTISESSRNQAEIGFAEIESVNDIPFWIWVVLPRLFPEKLPGVGGYTSLGIKWERGSELPIGFTKKVRGIPLVELNDPSNANFDVQRYIQFLVDCARDPRFNSNFILPEITYNINLSLRKKLVYRFSAIPDTKKALLAYGESST